MSLTQVYYPISKPMVGSTWPGALVQKHTVLANYNDFTMDPLVKDKKKAVEVHKFPDMQDNHSPQNHVMEMLKRMMQGHSKGPHPHSELQGKPSSGYEPLKENLQWRRS